MARTALRPRAAYPVFRDIPTRWMDNDVFGHVNNVVYYSWFDTAVCGHLVELGLLDYEAGDIIGLVVETSCRYARSVSFPQLVQAGIRVARLGTSSVRYEVGLFVAGEEEAAAEGYFVHVYVDRLTRRPAALPDRWRAALQALSVPAAREEIR